jgi:hypothetical protein
VGSGIICCINHFQQCDTPLTNFFKKLFLEAQEKVPFLVSTWCFQSFLPSFFIVCADWRLQSHLLMMVDPLVSLDWEKSCPRSYFWRKVHEILVINGIISLWSTFWACQETLESHSNVTLPPNDVCSKDIIVLSSTENDQQRMRLWKYAAIFWCTKIPRLRRWPNKDRKELFGASFLIQPCSLQEYMVIMTLQQALHGETAELWWILVGSNMIFHGTVTLLVTELTNELYYTLSNIMNMMINM